MSSARDFKGDYAPGGLTTASKWRAAGRRGGRASGIVRRQRSTVRPQPRHRSRQTALALRYRARQLTREEFDRRYRQVRPTGYQSGADTAWAHYVGLFRRYRRDGQHYKTTNGQRQQALSPDRWRCRRTIQRLNRLMGEMGLAAVCHHRDQGATAGHRDCLVVEMRSRRSENVTPPSGAGTSEAGLVPACSKRTLERAACKDLSPPTTSAENETAAASPPSTEREKIEAAIAFQQLKVDHGWNGELVRSTLTELKHRLRRIQERDGYASP